MSGRGKIKETVLLAVLNIALPSLDIYSDLAVILNFYIGGSQRNMFCDQMYNGTGWGQYQERFKCYYDESVPSSNMKYTTHFGWGTLMLVPFLLNYLICWYVWATTDKRKAFTWAAPLLCLYPQCVALKIIWQVWTDPKRGLQERKNLERNLVQTEVFFEAVPSTLIMTYLMARALGSETEGSEIIVNWRNLESPDSLLFFLAFTTSVITSSLGLAKNLKLGPCRILPEERGLLSPQFILIFFSCWLTLAGKGTGLTSAVDDTGSCGSSTIAGGAILAMSTFFLPGFLVSLFACYHRGVVFTFLAQPSIFLLPVFSHFTFFSKTKLKEEDEENGGGEVECKREKRFIGFSTKYSVTRRKEESLIMFSGKYTGVNAAASFAGILVHIFALPLLSKISESDGYWYCFSTIYINYGGLLCSIMGIILTLVVVAFSNNCNSLTTSCSSFSRSFEFGAILTSSPHTAYILSPDGQVVKVKETGSQESTEIIVHPSQAFQPTFKLVGEPGYVQSHKQPTPNSTWSVEKLQEQKKKRVIIEMTKL